MKVVINACYGGFSVSLDAARHMAANGCSEAKSEVDKYDAKLANPALLDHIESKFGVRWFGYLEVPRDNAQLVAAVEELGEKASGQFAGLRVVEIPDGVQWQIEEYDGYEHVAESHRTWS